MSNYDMCQTQVSVGLVSRSGSVKGNPTLVEAQQVVLNIITTSPESVKGIFNQDQQPEILFAIVGSSTVRFKTRFRRHDR